MRIAESIALGLLIGLLIWIIKEGATVWYMMQYYAY